MAGKPTPRKIPLIFYRTRAGREPVREWLQRLDEAERQEIGKDLLRAQWQRREHVRRSWNDEQDAYGIEHRCLP